jgi:hypothetical protein
VTGNETVGGNVTITGNVSVNVANVTTLNATSITNSGLTSGRVVYTTTGGLETTSGNLTFDGSTVTALNTAYTGTLTGGTGIVNLGSGQFYKDASGNVGIGTSSPTYKLFVVGSTGDLVQFTDNVNQSIRFGVTTTGIYYNNPNSGYQAWQIGGTERMRIDSSGNLLVGTTSARPNGLTADAQIVATTASSTKYPIATSASLTAAQTAIVFTNPNGNVGSIQTSGLATSYVTSSDYRLKENVAPMTGALDTVAQLKPVTYKWKVDGSSGQGFIAHELQAVVPECVSGEKDAVDKEGNIKPQGIDTSFLVATLTAAIQELNAKVNAQAAEIDTLKGIK